MWRALPAIFVVACSSTPSAVPTSPSGSSSAPAIRVLMLTATAGFRHDSIPAARQAMSALAARSASFTVTATEDLSDVTAARLSATDVLMFALTTGELAFDQNQKAAIVNFVNGGGGFIGVHSATDTLYEWADYGRLVGAYFKEHPWTQEAAIVIDDPSHPTMSGISGLRLLEEFYTFRENPRPTVHVVFSLDAASVGGTGDFPLAWTQSVGRGRTYYNALGHFSQTWNDTRFQTMMLNAIRWTSGR